MAKSLQFFSVFLLGICFSLSSAWKIQKRIIGGHSAGQNEFPYHVSLRTIYDDVHFCGGAIINNFFIVSAAHCFYREPRRIEFSVAVAGTNHVDRPGVRIELSRFKLVHANYDSSLIQNDIILIRTAKSIPFSDVIAPIALPKQSDIPSGSKVIVSGWGFVEEPRFDEEGLLIDQTLEKSLQFRESTTLDLEQCRFLFAPTTRENLLNENNICVETGNTFGTSFGDGGSPLVANDTLIGIVSWSVGHAEGFPDVYTNIFNFVDWIHKSINYRN